MCAEQQGRFNVMTWKMKEWRDKQDVRLQSLIEDKQSINKTGINNLSNDLTGHDIMELICFKLMSKNK